MKPGPSHVRKINPVGFTCKKKSYSTADEAWEAIEYIKENTYVRNLSAYRCSVCGLWHLTSKHID